MLRELALFAGIGGFPLGLERSGLSKLTAAVEIDPFCQKVLAKHWPGVPCHGDVQTREYSEGEADIITAGFPCQDISNAGNRSGLSGSRSGLYREVVRAIRVVRPRYALLENVAALLGRGMGTVLGDLAEVGHDAEWHCIPASAVNAPHRRDRVWIIAYPGGEQRESDRAPISGEIAKELFGATTDDCPPKNMADAGGGRREKSGVCRDAGNRQANSVREEADKPFDGGIGKQWLIEPNVGRVADGVPSRVDRLRSLGNALVPQIPEIIGRAIISSQKASEPLHSREGRPGLTTPPTNQTPPHKPSTRGTRP